MISDSFINLLNFGVWINSQELPTAAMIYWSLRRRRFGAHGESLENFPQHLMLYSYF